jgi:hypothetical protein
MSKRAYKKFSKEDREFIAVNYLLLSDKKLAKILDRSEENIRKQRQNMGLSRRKYRLKEVLADMPIIIWLPRDAFEGKKVDLRNLKIGD